MEPVPPNAGFAELTRQRKGLGNMRLAAMEGCVKAGDLGDVRRCLEDWCGLVRGCGAGAAAPAVRSRAKAASTSLIEADGGVKCHAPVDDAVPDAS